MKREPQSRHSQVYSVNIYRVKKKKNQSNPLREFYFLDNQKTPECSKIHKYSSVTSTNKGQFIRICHCYWTKGLQLWNSYKTSGNSTTTSGRFTRALHQEVKCTTNTSAGCVPSVKYSAFLCKNTWKCGFLNKVKYNQLSFKICHLHGL